MYICVWCTHLRTGWASLLRGRGIPPPAEEDALGRGRLLRGAARERVGVEVAELGVDVALTGCRKASGDGVAGVRSLLGEGTGDRQSRTTVRYNCIVSLYIKCFVRFESDASLTTKV